MLQQAGSKAHSSSLTVVRRGNDWIIAVPNADGGGCKVYRKSSIAMPGARDILVRDSTLEEGYTGVNTVQLVCEDGIEIRVPNWWTTEEILTAYEQRGARARRNYRGTKSESQEDPDRLPHPNARLLFRNEQHEVYATDPDRHTDAAVQIWIDGHVFTLRNRDEVGQVVVHENYVLVEYEEHQPHIQMCVRRVGTDHKKVIVWDGTTATTYITPTESGYSGIGPRFFDGKPWFAVEVDGSNYGKGYQIHWGEEVSEPLHSVRFLGISGNEPIYIASTQSNLYTPCLVRGVTIVDRGEIDRPHYNEEGKRISCGSLFLLVNGQAAYTRGDIKSGQAGWFDSAKSILVEGKVYGHFSKVYLLWADGKTLRAVVAGDDGVPTEVSYEIADR
ncbi:hypothetical protein KBA73_00500 [Patescibacteria group bacterium]|nr:hypothetical protein [Patescibacteria group bacterium]